MEKSWSRPSSIRNTRSPSPWSASMWTSRFLQVAQRGLVHAADPRAQQGQHPLTGFGNDRERRHRRAPESVDRDTCPRGLWQRGVEGMIKRSSTRREQDPVSRHLPRPCSSRDRVRAKRVGLAGAQLDRVRPRHAASGDRARDRMQDRDGRVERPRRESPSRLRTCACWRCSAADSEVPGRTFLAAPRGSTPAPTSRNV